jgi:hypothetical protein
MWFDGDRWRSALGWVAMGEARPPSLPEQELADRFRGMSSASILAIALPMLRYRRKFPRVKLTNMGFHARGVRIDNAIAEVRRRQAAEQRIAGRRER